jgi:hypothetical protein
MKALAIDVYQDITGSKSNNYHTILPAMERWGITVIDATRTRNKRVEISEEQYEKAREIYAAEVAERGNGSPGSGSTAPRLRAIETRLEQLEACNLSLSKSIEELIKEMLAVRTWSQQTHATIGAVVQRVGMLEKRKR